MKEFDKLIMDAYYKVVPMDWAYGGPSLALANIVREVEGLRQQLAAARDETAEIDRQWQQTLDDYEHCNTCLGDVRIELQAAEARAAAEGDRAAGLEARWDNVECGAEFLRSQIAATEARAEAAEAALADCQQCYANARSMVEEYMAGLHELRALRRVAEALYDVESTYIVADVTTKWCKWCKWEVDIDAEMKHSTECPFNSLAAWDAARGKGGDEGEQEHILGEGEAPSALAQK